HSDRLAPPAGELTWQKMRQIAYRSEHPTNSVWKLVLQFGNRIPAMIRRDNASGTVAARSRNNHQDEGIMCERSRPIVEDRDFLFFSPLSALNNKAACAFYYMHWPSHDG